MNKKITKKELFVLALAATCTAAALAGTTGQSMTIEINNPHRDGEDGVIHVSQPELYYEERENRDSSIEIRDDGSISETSLEAFMMKRRRLIDELAGVLIKYVMMDKFTKFIITPEMVDANKFLVG